MAAFYPLSKDCMPLQITSGVFHVAALTIVKIQNRDSSTHTIYISTVEQHDVEYTMRDLRMFYILKRTP